MKCLLLTLTLLVLPAFGAAQSTQTDKAAQEQAKREAKERKKAEELQRKAAEREAKERLKRPAQIEIKAPSDKVGAIIVQQLNTQGYQIAEEGKYRLVFTQEIGGATGAFGQAMMGGVSRPRRTVAFTVSEIGGVSTVTVDMSVTTEMRYGRVQRQDMNKNKRWRGELDNLLSMIKYQAETH